MRREGAAVQIGHARTDEQDAIATLDEIAQDSLISAPAYMPIWPYSVRRAPTFP